MQHKDLEIYFDLSASNDSDNLVEVSIGDLNLPTGQIIAGDPFFLEDSKPFVQTVQPGRYPVKLYLREIDPEHYRIAYAKIAFKPEKADHWILAVSEDMDMEELLNLQQDDFFGFAVDSGIACFLDIQTHALYQQKIHDLYTGDSIANYYENILAEEMKKYSANHPYSNELGDWNNHFPVTGSDLNILMFSSGWGDGLYPTYWGRNTRNELTELTIDFMVDPDEE